MSEESDDKLGEIEAIRAHEYVRKAYTIYGKYVIEERAVADYRDGLKPVQRRILWAMWTLGLKPKSAYKKSAKVVGETMGNYHPHGDAAIYSALVNMVWTRYQLIQGQGNFGGITDPPAAQRYTEARLAAFAAKAFECIDVGEFVPNYSGDSKEPLVLPSRAPYLLLNGSEGIAVGLSACIPPHNLKEVVGACKYVLKAKGKADVDGVLKHITGPDYGTSTGKAVLISSPQDIRTVYDQGWGVLHYRCSYEIQEQKDHKLLVINGYAPRFNVLTFINKCTALRDEGQIDYCVDNTSDDNGIQLTVGYTNEAALKHRVLPLLYTYINYQNYVTKREITKDESELPSPKFLPTVKLIEQWLDYRREVETAMINLEIQTLQETLWKQRAILYAIKHLDIVKAAIDQPADQMADYLIKEFAKVDITLSDLQANYILDTKVRNIAKHNLQDQKDAVKATKDAIAALEAKLKDIDSVVEEHLDALLPYADDRGTVISPEPYMAKSNITDANTEGDDGTKTIVAGSENGWLQKMGDKPSLKGKGWAWDYLIQTGQKFTIVEEMGMAYTAVMSYVKDGDCEARGVVGLIPSSKTKMVVLAEDGYGIVLDHPQSTLEFRTMKTDSKLIEVCGVSDGDQLIVWNNKHNHVYKWEELQSSRRNSAGWLLLPRQDKGVHITVLPDGHKLIGPDGSVLDFEEFMKVDTFFVVGNQNLVLFDSGTKSLADMKEAIRYIGSGGVTKVFNFE